MTYMELTYIPTESGVADSNVWGMLPSGVLCTFPQGKVPVKFLHRTQKLHARPSILTKPDPDKPYLLSQML